MFTREGGRRYCSVGDGNVEDDPGINNGDCCCGPDLGLLGKDLRCLCSEPGVTGRVAGRDGPDDL